MKKVVVAGGGVLGSQIAFQVAYCGFDVTIWLRSEGSIERCKPKIERLHNVYTETLKAMATPEGKNPMVFCRGLADPDTFRGEELNNYLANVEKAYSSLVYETDLQKAVKGADFIIESMSENVEAKTSFYKDLAPYVEEKTILLTNTSTLLPSMFAEYTGCPEKYLALHFANNIWKLNTAEIMGHEKTNPELLNVVAKFAEEIRMIPLVLYKEQPGYLLNSLLLPLFNAAESLWVNEVSDPKTIDLCWQLGTGAPLGPFQFIDIAGLNTAYNVESSKPGADDPNTTQGKICAKLKERIDAGKLGVETKEGFYKYE